MITVDVDALAEAIAGKIQPAEEGRWMTSAELAVYLGINPATVPSYVARGLPYSQPGGEASRRFFNTVDVDAWMRRQT